MFGMGFMEILLIAIVAIIALGPEKLPKAMVEIAKFLKKFKSGVEDAKSTLDNELNISEMKEEAAKFKAQIEDAKSTVDVKSNLNLGLDDILKDDLKTPVSSNDTEDEKVSFKEVEKEPVQNRQKEQVQQVQSGTNENVKKEEPKAETKVEEDVEAKAKKASSDKFRIDFDEVEVKDKK